MDGSRIELKGMNQTELEEFFSSLGYEKYRGKQMMKWLYNKIEKDFDAMTDFGRELRAKLSEKASIGELSFVTRYDSQEMNTEKYVFRLSDGNLIESVLMSYEDHLGPSRMTACISTQVGCAMGCTFCASEKGGFTRDLTCGEIVDQVLQLEKYIRPREMRVANVVMMGIGEPLLNYDSVMKAVKLLNHPDGLAIGTRHIAISTCGIVPGIERLTDEGLQIKLAISLHSTDDATRSRLMPINRKYPIPVLMKSLRKYQEVTGRRITVEYALIRGVNDSQEDARSLGELLKGFTALINLIPLNRIPEFPHDRPHDDVAHRFKHILDGYGIRTTIRKERGLDIQAACGQLRRQTAEQPGSREGLR